MSKAAAARRSARRNGSRHFHDDGCAATFALLDRFRERNEREWKITRSAAEYEREHKRRDAEDRAHANHRQRYLVGGPSIHKMTRALRRHMAREEAKGRNQ